MTSKPNTAGENGSGENTAVDQAAFHSIVHQMEDAIFILDYEWCFRYLNPKAERLLECTEAELLETCVWDEFPEAVDSTFQLEYQQAVETLEPTQFEEYYEPLDKWFRVHAYPFDSMLVVQFRDITPRREYESRREMLVRLYTMFQNVSKSLIQQSSQTDLEQSVCELLVSDNSYTAAWIGDIDWRQETISINASAGADPGIEEMVRPLQDGDVTDDLIQQVLETHTAELAYLPSDTTLTERERPQQDGNRGNAVAAVPIVYEISIYGILMLYADGSYTFTDDESTVLQQLGELLGHALAAIERKSALMNDDLVELDIHINDLTTALDIQASGTVTFDRIIPTDEDDFVVFGTVTTDGIQTLETLIDEFPHFETVSILTPETDPSRFELQVSEPPVASTIAANGGRIQSARIEEKQYLITVELPHSADIAQVVDAVQDQYPEADVVAQRQTVRSEPLPTETQTEYLCLLTDRQSEILEAAHAAGFFDWPRGSTGEEIADALGIQPPTFHKHIRKVEQTIFDHLLDDGEPTSS